MSSLNLQFEGVLVAAHTAGMLALEAARPTPMIVYTPTTISLPVVGAVQVIDQSKPVYHEPEGICGFAWIHIKGNTPFGRYAKAQGHASKDYPGGLMFWVREGEQSMTRKEAYAHAFAEVLTANGVPAVARSRMD